MDANERTRKILLKHRRDDIQVKSSQSRLTTMTLTGLPLLALYTSSTSAEVGAQLTFVLEKNSFKTLFPKIRELEIVVKWI